MVGGPRNHLQANRSLGFCFEILIYPTCRRIWLADDFPLAGLVGEAVADLKLHREDAALGWRRLADGNYLGGRRLSSARRV